VYECLKKLFRSSTIINSYGNWDQVPLKLNKKLIDYERIQCAISNLDELKDLSKKLDPKVTTKVIEELESKSFSIEAGDFCERTYSHDPCGGCIEEIIEFRPLWFVMLWIENLSDNLLKIEEYSGKIYYPNYGLECREISYSYDLGEKYTGMLPLRALGEKESILIPEYIILAPLKLNACELRNLTSHDMNVEFSYDYDLLRIDNPRDFLLIGNSFQVDSIKINGKEEKIHKFDPSNMLAVSKRFNVGSCPYLIGFKDGKVPFVKEILIRRSEEIDIRNYDYVILAEIEEEIAFIETLTISKGDCFKQLAKNVILKRGNYIRINNFEGYEKLFLIGTYLPKISLRKPPPDIVIYKYKNLKQFLTTSATSRYAVRYASPNP